eukprot:m.279550 g.279550  ORF g.279550 m.279550 type:complete len:98 (-) comp16323_c11_seq15:38-331(-)
MKRCSNARMVSPRCPIGLWCAFPSNNNSVMTTYGFSEIYHWHFYTIKVTALDISQEENTIHCHVLYYFCLDDSGGFSMGSNMEKVVVATPLYIHQYY